MNWKKYVDFWVISFVYLIGLWMGIFITILSLAFEGAICLP